MGELENASGGTPESSDRQRFGVFFYFFIPKSLDWQGFSMTVCVLPPQNGRWRPLFIVFRDLKNVIFVPRDM